MKARLKKVIVISAVLLLAGCAYAFLFSKTGLGIPCVFHLVTGLNCPGCGVTRMAASLLRLDLSSAFRANAAVLILSPAIAALLIHCAVRYVRFGTKASGKAASALAWVLAGLLLIWGVVRNVVLM